MTSNDDIIHAIGRLEAQTENVAVNMTKLEVVLTAHLVDDARRIGSLERARAALWTAIVTAKVMIGALFVYWINRKGM